MACIYVIIPVYNCKKYLYSTLESVIPQAKICLIDDGSTDGSGELCDELSAKDNRIHVIHQKNAGVSAARNAGIEYVMSVGDVEHDYIVFLDADDFWVKETLSQNVLNEIENEHGIDIYAFGNSVCNEDATRYAYPAVYDASYSNGGNEAIWKSKSHFASNLYALHLFVDYNIRFQVGLKYSEDKIFLLQCLFLANRIRFMLGILYVYRKNNASAMSRVSKFAPIDYFLPIIEGWVKSDIFLNQWENITGKNSCAGNILAGIYFGDMAAEHFKKWGKADVLLKVMRKHPNYNLFVHMNPKDVSPKQYREHELFFHHFRLFRIKYCLLGLLEFGARNLISMPLIKELRDKRRFPLNKEYFDNN